MGPTCTARWRLRAALLWENSFWTAEKARENLSSPTCFLSRSISSCARFFSVGSEHDYGSSSVRKIIYIYIYIFFSNRSRISVTLVCVGAVQLPVQRRDDGGQIGADAFLPQVHGDGSHELEHTRSLQTQRSREHLRYVY